MFKRNFILGTILSQLILCATVFSATYYVSPLGDNVNKGISEGQPFQSVQYAIDQMTAGDTLVVLDGLYTGTLKLKSGITMRAKNPRKAVFSGAEILNETFERHSGKIYKTKVDKSPKQLFYNDQPMLWARWPNMQWSENWENDKKWAPAADGTGPGVLTSDAFSGIEDLDLTGGYCFLRYGKGNSCYSRLIESFDGTTLHWNDDKFYTNTYTGEDGWRGTARALQTLEKSHVYHPINSLFFLSGAFDLLDAPGEWVVKENTLYIYPLDGKNPNKAVILTKTNDYCINEEGPVSDVKIEGIDFLAGSVKFGDAGCTNISILNVYFTYIGAELLYIDKVEARAINKPIQINGSNIRIEKCLFAGAQNSALSLRGSEITVQNCVFMENNRHANFGGRPLSLSPNGLYSIKNNTFFNNCSDAISIGHDRNNRSTNSDISYNNIFNGGKYNSDVSGIYMPTLSQNWAEVHHNWMHNIKGNAFRLDVAGKELNIHHNVFWSSKRGMSVEGYGQFNIYNNTDVHNETTTEIIKNQLNHVGATEASGDLTFPPIDDWNVLNNIIEAFADRIGPREKNLYGSQKEKGLVHPERATADEIHDQNTRPTQGNLRVLNRGSIQGNLIGKNPDIFTNGNLSGLNLIPVDNSIREGVSQTEELASQGVVSLDTYRGAYDVGGDYWYPGSDWMPYGLDVPKTMAQ